MLLRTVLLLALAFPSFARTLYVAPGGRDTNRGTRAAPFATISKGVAVLRAGDELVVRGGVYRESVTIWQKSNVRIRGAGKPVIEGNVSIGESAGVRFDSFEVRNGPKSGIAVYDARDVKVRWNEVHHHQEFGIHVASAHESPIGTTRDIVIEGNSVHHNVLSNAARTASSGWGQAIGAFRARNVTIRGNFVRENYGEGIDLVVTDRGRIVDNTVWDNFSVNIYLDNATCATVDRNFVITGWSKDAKSFYRGGGPAMGIHAANEKYAQQNLLKELTITNNIVVHCRFGFSYTDSGVRSGLRQTIVSNNAFVRPTDLALYIEGDRHSQTRIVNNIFYANGTDYTHARSTSIAYASNCWYGGKPGSEKRGTDDVYADPQFIDPYSAEKDDFKVRPSSPCRAQAPRLQ